MVAACSPDTDAPTVVCPERKVTVLSATSAGAAVTLPVVTVTVPTAVDACSSSAVVDNIVQDFGPQDGVDEFPVGVSQLEFSTVDEAGLQASCVAGALVVAPRRAPSLPSNPAGAYLGHSVSVSADGRTMVAGAYGRAGGGRPNAGSVAVFARDADGGWLLEQEVFAPTPSGGAILGHSVAISGDGSTIVAGAYGEDDLAWEAGAVSNRGAVYVFERDAATRLWTAAARVLAPAPSTNLNFGGVVSVSTDGRTLAAGATGAGSSGGRRVGRGGGARTGRGA